MMRIGGGKVDSNKCRWKLEEQLSAFRMESGNFLIGIPGRDTHGIEEVNLVTLGKSFPVCVHIHDSDESFDRGMLHFVFQISTRRQVGCWALQVCSTIFTV